MARVLRDLHGYVESRCHGRTFYQAGHEYGLARLLRDPDGSRERDDYVDAV